MIWPHTFNNNKMPGKKKGKGKKGKKKAKKPKGMLEMPGVVVKRLSKAYIDNCAKRSSVVCPGLKKLLKECYENDRLIVRVGILNLIIIIIVSVQRHYHFI